MTAAGIVVVWLGYGLASYGWLLVQGYDITFRQWFSPINPLTSWPAKGSTPATTILPT